jgi:hypothetical protein
LRRSLHQYDCFGSVVRGIGDPHVRRCDRDAQHVMVQKVEKLFAWSHRMNRRNGRGTVLLSVTYACNFSRAMLRETKTPVVTTGESPPAYVFEGKRLRELGWVGFGVLGFLEMKLLVVCFVLRSGSGTTFIP